MEMVRMEIGQKADLIIGVCIPYYLLPPFFSPTLHPPYMYSLRFSLSPTLLLVLPALPQLLFLCHELTLLHNSG